MENKITLEKSNRPNKKFKVVLNINDKKKTIHFGDNRYDDFTVHKDEQRKKNYLSRHIHDPKTIDTAGFWSRELLWSKPNMKDAIKHVEKKTGVGIKAKF